MAPESKVQQFVLLPPRGLRSTGPTSSPAHVSFFRATDKALSSDVPYTFDSTNKGKVQMRILDSIREDGAKLVELSPDDVPALRAHQPGLRIVPIKYYYPAVVPKFKITTKAVAEAAVTASQIKLKITSKEDHTPVGGAMVSAFTDFANGDRSRWQGDGGITNDEGEVNLFSGSKKKKIERLYIYPPSFRERGTWGTLRKNLTITSGMEIELTPLNLTFTDALRHFYGNSPDNAGESVKVAVVDTGIAEHPDLNIQGGMNTVIGEDPNDFGDNGGEGHGTHVAGTIAAHGEPPPGVRGVAPAAILRSYRVFPQEKPGEENGASNYSIIKAIDQAVSDGCDLINLSLGGTDPDDATRAAIEDARSQGCLVIAAAGNENRSPVYFPAADPPCIAVSALGRIGTFPDDSIQAGEIEFPPSGEDESNFVASFSNIGPEIDVIGAGVGIISTVPEGYAIMDGTSMACPAVVGFTAKLLSEHPEILSMNRDQARSDAIAQVLLQSAKPLGFGPEYEGHGIPIPE